MPREVWPALVGLALAAVYFMAADALPHSLLSDEVGADGLPKALAVGLGLLCAFQLVRVLRARNAGADRPTDWHAHRRAAGLLLIGAVYVAVVGWFGYPLAIAALIAVAAWYAGAVPSLRLAAIAAVGAVALWGMFAKLLAVSM